MYTSLLSYFKAARGLKLLLDGKSVLTMKKLHITIGHPLHIYEFIVLLLTMTMAALLERPFSKFRSKSPWIRIN